jgi:hypothetical protein
MEGREVYHPDYGVGMIYSVESETHLIVLFNNDLKLCLLKEITLLWEN